MPSIGSLLGPTAAAGGIAQSLATARAANPRAASQGAFDQHFDLALRTGIGGGPSLNSAGGGGGEAGSPLSSVQLGSGSLGEVTSIEALRVEHRTATAEFEDHFRRLLREHGIDVGEGIVLETDSQGDVRVAGDHPQKQAIEQLFRENADLRNRFVQIDAQASLLHAADLAAELTRLQDEAPTDAARQVQELLGGPSPGKFSLAVLPDKMVVQFA